MMVLFSGSAVAAEAAGDHLHIGQKVANYLRSKLVGIPDVAILALISAMPVIELRGAVPVGLWMGLPLATVLPACVLGNMIPIIPLLYLLRNEKLKYVHTTTNNTATTTIYYCTLTQPTITN